MAVPAPGGSTQSPVERPGATSADTRLARPPQNAAGSGGTSIRPCSPRAASPTRRSTAPGIPESFGKPGEGVRSSGGGSQAARSSPASASYLASIRSRLGERVLRYIPATFAILASPPTGMSNYAWLRWGGRDGLGSSGRRGRLARSSQCAPLVAGNRRGLAHNAPCPASTGQEAAPHGRTGLA